MTWQRGIFVSATICLIFLSLTNAAPTSDGPLVAVADDKTPAPTDLTLPQDTKVKHPSPELYSMRVQSQVNSRYATTLISSRVANPANVSQEVVFSVVIPETAFISGFLMELDDKVYKAYVKEKEVAKKEYDDAVAGGLAAAHVAVSARDSNKFTVSVNVEALSKATFNLTYEELLTRRLNVYNLIMNLHPGQLVRDLTVDVNINELKKITALRTPTLRTGNEVDADENTETNPFATFEYTNPDHTSAHVKFSPTVEQQKELMKAVKNTEETSKTDAGLSGQFVVQYDVERDPQGGEVIVYDGYFAHFFAPSNLKPLNKHAVFVLDISGSMLGRKMTQLKEAMLAILDDLQPGDYFNIIEFSFKAKVWNFDKPELSPVFGNTANWYYEQEETTPPPSNVLPPAYPATAENIQKAKKIINKMDAGGGTNIYDALTTALKLCKAGINRPKQSTEPQPSTLDPKPNPSEMAAVPTEQTTVETSTESAPAIQSDKKVPEPMIIFLTDGDPTVGETNPNKIISAISELNSGSKTAALFSLAFGEDADRGFLKKVALKNAGFMRHIYEAADASIQLQHFYRQIASPLLSNVKFAYPPDQIEEVSITKHDFHILFSGSEIVIAGKLAADKESVSPHVTGFTGEGAIDFIPTIIGTPIPEKEKKPSLERLWAYLTIKQLLDKKDAHIDPEVGPVVEDGSTSTSTTVKPAKEEDIKSPEKQALDLALKYSFVTPLTSLVVVKPNSSSAVEAQDASAGNRNGYHALPLNFHPGAALGPSPISGFAAQSFSGHGLSGGGHPPNRLITGRRHPPKRYRSRTKSRVRVYESYVAKVPSRHRVGASTTPISVDRLAGGFSGPPGPPIYSSAPAASFPAPLQPADRVDTGYEEESFSTLLAAEETTTIVQPLINPDSVQLDQFGLQSLHWLNALTTSPDLVQLPTGSYKLGTNSTVTEFESCTNSVNNTNGTCVFLSSCPGSLPALTDLDTYLKHFCDVKGYAGICCEESSKN